MSALRESIRGTGRGGTAVAAVLALALALVAGLGVAAPPQGHPHPQPLPAASTQTVEDGVVVVRTGESLFPPSEPFRRPPGTNLLPTIYTNLFDGNGAEIPNTLPSTPTVAYNLHDGPPEVSEIDPASPTQDLHHVFTTAPALLDGAFPAEGAGEDVSRLLRLGIDVLEGNPVPERAYSGFPLLHYTGPDKLKKVEPIVDAGGKVVGGNVDVRQVWYDTHVESDTALLDVSAVAEVPWTITYTVDVLDRGKDDFSPYVMYADPPPSGGGMARPLAGMDQSFFPMDDGTRTVFKIKMAPGKYFSLVYTWGWRFHPPRIQVIENVAKTPGPPGLDLLELEQQVFGPAPRSSEQAKLAAIGRIGDLDPAKRMWSALREAGAALGRGDRRRARALLVEGREAFFDWKDRTQLPRGVKVDRESDLTLLYVNNTIYGEFTDGALTQFPDWQTRGAWLKVTLYNGDSFDHGYHNIDFGGARGWENQFKSSVKFGGSGCWFTFGRNYWWPNLKSMITVPAADKAGRPGMQKVHVQFNYDPSRRLRFYQFDPMHHDVAVFSVH